MYDSCFLFCYSHFLVVEVTTHFQVGDEGVKHIKRIINNKNSGISLDACKTLFFQNGQMNQNVTKE